MRFQKALKYMLEKGFLYMETILCFILSLQCTVLDKQTKDMDECHTRALHYIYCWLSVHCTHVMFELQMECNLNRVKKG